METMSRPANAAHPAEQQPWSDRTILRETADTQPAKNTGPHPLSPLIGLALATIPWPAPAGEFHVSPAGKDTNNGAAGSPFATLGAARDAARKLAGKEPVTIHVADGIYSLPETLVFQPEDSGTMENPILWHAANEGKASLSATRLAPSWRPASRFCARTGRSTAEERSR